MPAFLNHHCWRTFCFVPMETLGGAIHSTPPISQLYHVGVGLLSPTLRAVAMSLVQFSSLLVAVDQINTGPPESPLSVEVTLPEHELPQTQSQPSQPPQYENLNEECKRKTQINVTIYFKFVSVPAHPVPIYYVACGKCQHVIPRVSPEAGRVKCSVCQEDTVSDRID